VNRSVRARTCKCGAAILAGLNRDWLAIDTTLDAQPVDNLGEALALMQGRSTYDLRPLTGYGATGRQMQIRNATRISQPRQHPVHAEHRCGQPLPPAVVTASEAVSLDDLPRNKQTRTSVPF
jgi:hypothetical protein